MRKQTDVRVLSVCGPRYPTAIALRRTAGTRHGGRRDGRVRQAAAGEGWKMSDHDGGEVGAVDLDRMSVQQLTALIAAAEAKRREKLDEARVALRAEMERKAAELGLSAGDLFAQTAPQETTGQGTRRRRPRSDAGVKYAAKYRGPSGEEWSGRGRTPRWLVALEAEGRRREEFSVKPELRLP
jgi:DNA-binding protein H-NS